MQLQIGGRRSPRSTTSAATTRRGSFRPSLRAPHDRALSQIRVAYTNDGTTAGGVDSNLRVDGVDARRRLHQAEAADVYSTGTYVPGIGAVPGLWQSEYLHANGYLQFASTAVPGMLALGTSLISVNEGAGTVSIPVVRTGGSDGTVGLRYTTVNATATAGSDYTAPVGHVGLRPRRDDQVDRRADHQRLARASQRNIQRGDRPGDRRRDGDAAAHGDDHRSSTTTARRRRATATACWGRTYNDADLRSARVRARPTRRSNFNWGTRLARPASIGADTFSVRWTGKVEARFSETFTFRTTSDDGVRLWVNNQLIIDQWIDHGAMDHFGSIALERGGPRHHINGTAATARNGQQRKDDAGDEARGSRNGAHTGGLKHSRSRSAGGSFKGQVPVLTSEATHAPQ